MDPDAAGLLGSSSWDPGAHRSCTSRRSSAWLIALPGIPELSRNWPKKLAPIQTLCTESCVLSQHSASSRKIRTEGSGWMRRELLRSNVPGSMRNVALLYGDEWVWRAYGRMLHSVQTGKPGFTAAHEQSFYEFLDEHAAAAAVFQAAMDDFSNNEAAAILGAYSFSDVRSIVDVGSGRGALLTAILQAYPQLRGVAFDMPSAEGECMRRFDGAGLSGRSTFVGGDFFRSLPAGYDLYLLKSVLHNWDDNSVVRVLEVCRQAMSPASRLLIVERVITDDQRSAEAKLFDINMLVTVGGRERTEQDYRTLLASAGFVLTHLFATSSPLTIVESAPQPK